MTPLAALVAVTLLDRIPGVAYGLPLVLVAAIVFAATHHEDPDKIKRATFEWIGWLGGILGGVLIAVWLVSWLA
jgi:hypothetical protein